MKDANEKVAKLPQDLESKQAQWENVKHIQEGARNKKKITLWKMQNIDGNFPPQTSRGNIWQENIEILSQNYTRCYWGAGPKPLLSCYAIGWVIDHWYSANSQGEKEVYDANGEKN
jgi:hypothetical protein